MIQFVQVAIIDTVHIGMFNMFEYIPQNIQKLIDGRTHDGKEKKNE